MASCSKRKRVLLVGWSGAGWDALSDGLDGGRLPHLAALVERGTLIRLDSRGVHEPAAWWTTVATGQPPERHGIVLSFEPNAYSGRSEAPPATLRRTRALWNLAEASGLTALAAGWPATHPAEALGGAMVSDRFPDVLGLPGYQWPLLAGSVTPETLAAELAPLRVASNDFAAADMAPFLPDAAARLAAGDMTPGHFAAECARTASTHAAATALLKRVDWDLALVHYDLPQRVAARLPRDTQLPARALGWLDAMLGALVRIVDAETQVFFVASPAAHASGLWLPFGQDPPEGLLCVAGPGAVADAWGRAGTIYDVAPTALAALGLREASLPGEARVDAWSAALPELAAAGDGAGGMHPVEPAAIGAQVAGELEDLAREGYTVAADANSPAREARRAYALALVDLAEGRTAGACGRLREAARLLPGEPLPFLVLAFLAAISGREAEARRLLREFPEQHPCAAYVAWIEALLALKAGREVEARALAGRARTARWGRGLLAALLGDVHRAARRWPEAAESYREALATGELYLHPALALAEVLLHTGQDREAERLAREAARRRPHAARIHLLLGIARFRLKRFSAARRSLETALRLDARLGAARRWLARAERDLGAMPC
jgi:Flp pilus assembly protein TadD